MIIKVCGMREPQNIREVAALAINWIGFIFYERSKRFVERCPTEQQVTDSEQLSPKKVGVFVNATIESMMEKASAYKLDYLQLHGNESPEDCHTCLLYTSDAADEGLFLDQGFPHRYE